MAKNKVIFGGEVLIDLTGDTVTASDVASGVKFHLPSGEVGTGTNTYDSDTSDDTAQPAEILNSKTAHARGSLLTGTMPNRGQVTGTISTKAGSYTIAQGYHDGSGSVSIATTEQNKIIASNIKAGIQILGVTGTYTGEGVSAQAKTVASRTSTAITITPDSGYDYLSEVTINPIAYSETPNAAGGVTVTIGVAE